MKKASKIFVCVLIFAFGGACLVTESLYAQRGGGGARGGGRPAMGRPAGGAPSIGRPSGGSRPSTGRPMGGGAAISTPNRVPSNRVTPSRMTPDRVERPAVRTPERPTPQPRVNHNPTPNNTSAGRPTGGYNAGRPMGGRDAGRPTNNNNAQRREPSRNDSFRAPERREPGRPDQAHREPGRLEPGRIAPSHREPSRDSWADRHPEPGRPGPSHPDPHHHGFMPPPPPPGGPGHHHPGHYDPHPWHGRPGDYRPVYPWWVGIAEFGAGLAIGYRMGAWQDPYYYYYPQYVVPTDGQTVVYENNTTIVVQDSAEEAEPEPADQTLEQPILEPVPITEADTEKQSVLRKDLNLSDEADHSDITKEKIDDSWKTIQEADTLFASGKSTEAVKNYRQVAESLEVMPDPWFRLAVAEASLKDYSAAMDNCLKGMDMAKQWPTSPFSLDYMYQGDQARKSADLAAMEKALSESPDNSDLYFLAGVLYYSDGQTDKATSSLTRAKTLSTDLGIYVDPMLKNIEESGKITDK